MWRGPCLMLLTSAGFFEGFSRFRKSQRLSKNGKKEQEMLKKKVTPEGLDSCPVGPLWEEVASAGVHPPREITFSGEKEPGSSLCSTS